MFQNIFLISFRVSPNLKKLKASCPPLATQHTKPRALQKPQQATAKHTRIKEAE
jgi:hypothetical protein